VLRGAKELINRQSVGVLQFEYTAGWARAGDTLASAIALLEGGGYSVFLLKKKGLHAFNYQRYGEYLGYSNFVGVSKKFLPLLRQHLMGDV